MDINQLSSKIIGAAIEVHKTLGPGLLESAYQKCLCHELRLRGTSLEEQKPLPLVYRGEKLDCGYQMDLLVENTIIVELKSCEKLEPIHKAQLLTYLKLSGLKLGLLLNFNVPLMRDGIVRVVNEFEEYFINGETRIVGSVMLFIVKIFSAHFAPCGEFFL